MFYWVYMSFIAFLNEYPSILDDISNQTIKAIALESSKIEQLSCLMDDENDNSASVANGRRKKRSTTEEKQKYGCPTGFDRVSQYICLHFRTSPDGNVTQSTYSEAKSYCKSRSKDSELVALENNEDTSRLWIWLGKTGLNYLSHLQKTKYNLGWLRLRFVDT